MRPAAILRNFLNPLVRRSGLTPVLAVRGRKSGEWRPTPVWPLKLNGRTYLVAPRGETQWVRNLRAAGGEGELRSRGQAIRFRATEVTGEERAAVVQAYRTSPYAWGLGYQFRELPEASDHPTFLIEE